MGLLNSVVSGTANWLEDRTGLVSLARGLGKLATKPVPRGLSWAYTLGSVALFLFTLQFLTGFLLLSHYAPEASVAYRSIQKIENQVALGWLVRQMHSWGASFVIAALVLHMLKVLWYGGYKKPREATWIAGVLLLFVALVFCFSGYLLPWNQLARWATAVGTDSIKETPLVGDFLATLLCGGKEVSGQTLGRFFAIHVFVCPALLIGLLVLHLALVQKHGIAPHVSLRQETMSLGYLDALERSGGWEPFFPRQVYRDLIAINISFALLVLAAAFWPWELGPPAGDETPVGIKPEWYFLPVYQFLKYFDQELVRSIPVIASLGIKAELLGLIVVNTAVTALVLLPFLDRGNNRSILRRPLFLLVGTISFVAVIGLGFLGHFSGRTVEILGTNYQFSGKGYPARVEEPATPPEPPRPAEKAETVQSPALQSVTSAARAAALLAAGECGACHKHERQFEDWSHGVHSRAAAQGSSSVASACVNCHGGNAAAKDADEAHKGILTREGRRGQVKVSAPEEMEIVEICSRCHGDVAAAFSKDHTAVQPAKYCSACHSNHRVLPAGLATFEKGYEGADPRAERFAAVRKAAGTFEGEWETVWKSIETLRAALEEKEALLSEFDLDLSAAREARRELRVLTHSFDAQEVEKARTPALEALERARKAMEERLDAFDRRKYLAAAIGTVSLLFAGLLAANLHRLRRREAAEKSR